MANILITGGSGFIGSHLVKALSDRGDSVMNIDVQAPFVSADRGHWRELDLLDYDGVSKVLDEFQPHRIFNLAAIADILKGKDAFEVNTAGLLNLLKATADWSSKPRIIHASTQLVAGPGHKISGPRDYHPYTEYGESKARSEEVLWNWSGDIEWTIIRPTTVWGPLYPTFAKSTWFYLYKRWYLVPTRTETVRTYSYVGNLVSQLIAAADAPAAKVDHKMFYGGDASIPTSTWLDSFSRAFTGKPTRRIPHAILKALAIAGDASGKIGGPSPINSGRLYRMTADFQVPLEPALETLGPLPYTLDQGVAETVAWLRSAHADRYR